jgi:G3E family GTPase
MTPTTLVIGGHAAAREAAIAAALDPALHTVILLEGLPDGRSALQAQAESARIEIVRIAAGCPCCIGNLTLRVTLNRILRRPPQRLYIGLAGTAHLDPLRQFLHAPPYDSLLQLNQDLAL